LNIIFKLIIICVGVYFEKLLKHNESSIWIKNLQMYLWSTPITLLAIVVHDLPVILEKGFFFDYNILVLLIIRKCILLFIVIFSVLFILLKA